MRAGESGRIARRRPPVPRVRSPGGVPCGGCRRRRRRRRRAARGGSPGGSAGRGRRSWAGAGLSAGAGGRPQCANAVWDAHATPIARHHGAPESRQPHGPRYSQAMGPQSGSAVLERREIEAPIRVDTRAPGQARRGRRRVADPPRPHRRHARHRPARGRQPSRSAGSRCGSGWGCGPPSRSSRCSPWSAAPRP